MRHSLTLIALFSYSVTGAWAQENPGDTVTIPTAGEIFPDEIFVTAAA